MSIKTRLAKLEEHTDMARLYMFCMTDGPNRQPIYHVNGQDFTLEEFRARYHSEPEAHALQTIDGLPWDSI